MYNLRGENLGKISLNEDFLTSCINAILFFCFIYAVWTTLYLSVGVSGIWGGTRWPWEATNGAASSLNYYIHHFHEPANYGLHLHTYLESSDSKTLCKVFLSLFLVPALGLNLFNLKGASSLFSSSIWSGWSTTSVLRGKNDSYDWGKRAKDWWAGCFGEVQFMCTNDINILLRFLLLLHFLFLGRSSIPRKRVPQSVPQTAASTSGSFECGACRGCLAIDIETWSVSEQSQSVAQISGLCGDSGGGGSCSSLCRSSFLFLFSENTVRKHFNFILCSVLVSVTSVNTRTTELKLIETRTNVRMPKNTAT